MEIKLQAEKRDGAGKGVARKLRAAGRVPAVYYGPGVDQPAAISVDAREMQHLLHGAAGANTLVDLIIDGEEHLTLPREIQRDYIRGTVIHVDFLAVSRTATITVEVPVVETGEAAGVREGGVVEHHLREVHVECLPQDVPEQIEVDITDVELGQMVHVSDIPVPDGITILNEPGEAVLSVVTPAILRVEADLSVPGEEGLEGVEAPEGEAAEGEVPEGEGGEAPAEGEEAPASEEGGES